ncbi:relaxin receptor 2-like isoform X2 [Zophobas morio]|uniref:relaxin receptor 2-like isoform X2 n=1 Tax=Zophobas morio TaxID=2755281 RepID=UPI0030834F9F
MSFLLSLFFGALTLRAISHSECDDPLTGFFIKRSHCSFFTFPPFGKELPSSVRSLEITQSKITYLGEKAFKGLTILNNLNLGSNEITSIGENLFKDLKNLRVLNLEKNMIRVIKKNMFDGLESLERLYLDDNSIERIEEAAFANLKLLNFLSLHYNRLAAMPYCADFCLPNLTYLNLGGNKLGSVDGSFLKEHIKLTELYLYNCSIESVSDGAFSSLSALTLLNLHYNKITKICGETFKGLHKLQLLNLLDNKIKSVSSQAFSMLGKLTYLNLYKNPITEIGPNAFSSSFNFTHLVIGLDKTFLCCSRVTYSFLNFPDLLCTHNGAHKAFSKISSKECNSNHLSSDDGVVPLIPFIPHEAQVASNSVKKIRRIRKNLKDGRNFKELKSSPNYDYSVVDTCKIDTQERINSNFRKKHGLNQGEAKEEVTAGRKTLKKNDRSTKKGVLATSRNGNLLKYALIISCPSVAIILVVSVLAVYYRKRKGKVVEKLCHRKAQRQGTFLVNPTFKPADAEHLNISIA